MKKLIAKRRLKHGCDQCKEPILKGQVYYRKRTVIVEEGKMFGYTVIYCSKCKYKHKQWKPRYEKFKEKCNHPEKFINEVWTYIPGEAVKEPSHCECMLCGKIL
ncbi:hypothetical protein [Tissierella pigra]|uniref:Uncharacterized protein n=1 Tax=Tissierella pigra TaxID=2607614 RepID=A0A6N7Y513_9FIRM|nr:hypothetical protein [Tissierella pigra]MSU03548.1 hypothetical protein [Tissierella pigra]